MTATLAEVHTIYESNARSIPDMLRKAADSIEAEADEECSPTTAIMAVQLTADGQVQIYGWGDINGNHEALGILQRGMHWILNNVAAEVGQ